MYENLKYWVWLSAMQGISARKARLLIEKLGNPINIYMASEKELKTLPFLNESIISRIIDKNSKAQAEKHLENIYKEDITVVTLEDNTYSEYLKNIYDPPIVLYVKGKLINEERPVAVVGSRRATQYGLSMAESIASDLARHGITTVSGMARGVDSFVHRGSLKAGVRTIAVLGCGLDIPYPYENKSLMDEIEACGAVISEYVPGTPPVPQNFPARNRIISGLSMGVVVIEANERSGSLITANFALDQGREVFALPGNINNFNSKGTNQLIREGAKIVTSIEDILEELRISDVDAANEYKSTSWKRMISGLTQEEIAIAKSLEVESMHIDMISEVTGQPISIVNSMLVLMEMKGVVEQLPGKIFKLNI